MSDEWPTLWLALAAVVFLVAVAAILVAIGRHDRASALRHARHAKAHARLMRFLTDVREAREYPPQRQELTDAEAKRRVLQDIETQDRLYPLDPRD